MSKKRTIDSFFSSSSTTTKKQKTEDVTNESTPSSNHPTYPFPIPHLPPSLSQEHSSWPAVPARAINDQPDLDLLYFEPFIPSYAAKPLFHFLRAQLPFYRVEYKIKRGPRETQIRTPRYTTVFGLDATSFFSSPSPSASSPSTSSSLILDAKSRLPVPPGAYARYTPTIPKCLDDLRRATESATGCAFNFCLVNYYASGADSISYHSDDERFLGPEPAIASFSLGARRDFYMKHKQPPVPPPQTTTTQLRLPLGSGDMVLMRGSTQANWLHSIPKRTGRNERDGGRINITFRRAMVKGGTDNYYNYNVGTGPVYRWDAEAGEMRLWKKPVKGTGS